MVVQVSWELRAPVVMCLNELGKALIECACGVLSRAPLPWVYGALMI